MSSLLSKSKPENSSGIDKLRLRAAGALAAGDPSGAAVLFLHGWGSAKESWTHTLERCPPGFYFVALDLPGSGETPPFTSWDADAFAEWIIAAADEMGLERFALVGHSMGGNVAAHAAQAAPKRVWALALVNAALQSHRLPLAFLWNAPLYGRALMWSAWAGSGLLGQIEEAYPQRQSGGFWRPLFRRSQYVQRFNSVETLQSQIAALMEAPFDLRALSPKLSVLIMHGRLDTTVPVQHNEEAAALRPKNTALIVYPDGYHCPMDEKPDVFARDLFSFLAAHAPVKPAKNDAYSPSGA